MEVVEFLLRGLIPESPHFLFQGRKEAREAGKRGREERKGSKEGAKGRREGGRDPVDF